MTRWLREFTNEGDVILRIGRDGDALVAEWPGFAELRATRDGSSYDFRPAEGADPVFVEKFHAGLVRALLRHARGEQTLHGSCITRGDRAVVIIGESGDGKSSLAAAACKHEEVALLADDTTPVGFDGDGRLIAAPSETVCWLRGEALEWIAGTPAGPKVACTVARSAESPAEIVAVVRLVWEDIKAPLLRQITGARAFDQLARSLFRFVVDEPEVELNDFAFVARIANGVPIYELARPRDIARLNASVDMIIELLRGKEHA